MTTKLFLPKVAKFIDTHWQSDTHRRMFQLGQVVVKVSAMFSLVPGEEVPEEAKAVAILYLEAMGSGDAATYARYDAQAIGIYREWLASRELQ